MKNDKLVIKLMRRYQRLDKPLREVLEEAIEASYNQALKDVEDWLLNVCDFTPNGKRHRQFKALMDKSR